MTDLVPFVDYGGVEYVVDAVDISMVSVHPNPDVETANPCEYPGRIWLRSWDTPIALRWAEAARLRGLWLELAKKQRAG